jgi:hypothetical protein
MRGAIVCLVLISCLIHSSSLNKPPQLFYYSSVGELFGPFERKQLEAWYFEGYFPPDTPVTEDPSSGVVYSIDSLFYEQYTQQEPPNQYEAGNDHRMPYDQRLENMSELPEAANFDRDYQGQQYDDLDEYQYDGQAYGYSNDYNQGRKPQTKKRWSLSALKSAAATIGGKLKKIKVSSIPRPSVPKFGSKSKKSDEDWTLPDVEIGLPNKANNKNVTISTPNEPNNIQEKKPDINPPRKLTEPEAQKHSSASSNAGKSSSSSTKKREKPAMRYSVKSLPKDDVSAWESLDEMVYSDQSTTKSFFRIWRISTLTPQLPSAIKAMKTLALKVSKLVIPKSLITTTTQDFPRLMRFAPMQTMSLFTAFACSVMLEIAFSLNFLAFLSTSPILFPSEISIFSIASSYGARVRASAVSLLLRFSTDRLQLSYPIFVLATIEKLNTFVADLLSRIPAQIILRVERAYLLLSSLIMESAFKIVKFISSSFPSLSHDSYPVYFQHLSSIMSIMFAYASLQYIIIYPLQQSILLKSSAELSANAFIVMSTLWSAVVNAGLAYLTSKYLAVLPLFHLSVLGVTLLGLYGISNPSRSDEYESIPKPLQSRYGIVASSLWVGKLIIFM